MVDDYVLEELACRASNLAERTLIVERLAKDQGKARCSNQLEPLDSWNIKKLTGKLAVQVLKDSYEQEGKVSQSIIEDLRKLLTDYKLYERNWGELSAADRLEFVKPHRQWLETYRAAIATLDLPKGDFLGSSWYEPDIYHGKLAIACEPFLRLLHQRLQPLCDQLKVISKQVVSDLQLHLLNRFELALTWTVEANINVYCLQNKIAKSADDPEAYLAYLEQTFQDGWSYHRFYFQFPVLSRWLAQVTGFLCDFGEEVIQRLARDREQISGTFFSGKPITQVKSFKLGNSDYHAGGKSVVIVELELINSEPATIVYKPRCIQSEAAMQGLLETLTRDKVVDFASYEVLCRDGYGYAEFITSGKNHVQSQASAEGFYQQLGGFLSIFYILGGGDLHFENVLVADGKGFICDCETVLEVLPLGMDKLPGTVLDSVFKTGLLEWPDPGDKNQMKLSGSRGGDSYEIPHQVPKVNEGRMSLGLGVEYQSGIRVEFEATNRIYYQGQLVQPQEYKDAIVEGFNRVYNWFRENPTKAATSLQDLFSPSLVRLINWGTQAYAKLIIAARHPKCLAEPLEVDLLFNTLKEHQRKWDNQGKLAELELASLWQLDIPIFSAKATGPLDLIHNYQQSLPDAIAISPLDNAVKRIEKLSEENRIRQNQYIYSSLSTEELNSPYFIASAVNYAQQIGWQLWELLEPDPSKAPWQTCDYTATGKRVVDIGPDIYAGSAGICLFLAYLDALHPQPEFRQAAERAFKHAMEHPSSPFVGAYQGTAGLIYLLTHLAQLWDRPELLERAVELTHELMPRIPQDKYFDLLLGVTGVIPVMVGLANTTSGQGRDIAIDCAVQSAQYLLQGATRQGDTLSWQGGRPDLNQQNLTGFSHGSSGPGWALILLGCDLDKQEYIQAGRQCFAYEATHFDREQNDWYDLRKSIMVADRNEPHFANAWCNGATGIGLSRIASWAALGKNDEDILREAYAALNATLRNFDQLGNDSLCHGRSGNAELLLRFSQLRDTPYLQMEANVQAQAQWRRFEKARTWLCGSTTKDLFPDLMLGIAGIGMHFLRLAYPERVPSPLLLDPPPSA
ncbi:type 2 lanthipeptide synthetase LanM family protein [Moorena sp. SIO3A2]|uniref:type 2 lanthipeptide synthetase LanM family protein n=1 Tax=Moorena sp. SIO3A2 TaxID=2607841 RepID=UPI0013BA0377|nr:type 2 lanthipeptide synthetase LanM family protein [Moorena sp. SIO3A2]NER91961.1 type 2 lantipeptide synthetase LanM [Moorena sp. SIO3A2]